MLKTRNQIVAAGVLGLVAAAPATVAAADPAKAAPLRTLDAAGPLAQEPFEALGAQPLRPVADVPISRPGRAEERLARSYRTLYRRAKRRDLSPGATSSRTACATVAERARPPGGSCARRS
ncbi:MAG: hypothetical protein WKF31_05390 [Thermoleophilaceae bacterium]